MAEKKPKKIISTASPEERKLNRSIDAVLRTEAGRVVWGYLFNICGYNVTSLTKRADGEIARLATECKESQRYIYIQLRNRASKELLAKAEELAEEAVPATPKSEEGGSK